MHKQNASGNTAGTAKRADSGHWVPQAASRKVQCAAWDAPACAVRASSSTSSVHDLGCGPGGAICGALLLPRTRYTPRTRKDMQLGWEPRWTQHKQCKRVWLWRRVHAGAAAAAAAAHMLQCAAFVAGVQQACGTAASTNASWQDASKTRAGKRLRCVVCRAASALA
jgi:hypothetical protein